MKKIFFFTFIIICLVSGIKSQEINIDDPIINKKKEIGLDLKIVQNLDSFFDYTVWYRRDLSCSSTIKNKTTDNRFVGYIYLKHKKGDTYTTLIPFWLKKNQDNEDKPITTDIIIDILDVDYPKPFNAELIDCLTGKIQNINFQADDYKVVFKNITVSNYPKIIRFNALMTRGYLKGKEPKTEEDKVKTARTIRKIKQKTDSWSPLAENQIIAQPTTIRPIVSHGGYHQLGNKRAVIWTNNKKLTGYFEIINQNNNRQHPATQPVVYKGKLKDAGNHIWGGNNLIAYFSDFKELGFYKIRLVFDQDERGITDSYSFTIKSSLYVDLAQKASEFLYYQRCGAEIPGWHKACHTDDAVIMPDGQRIDASGGWHSAGDLNKWIGPAHFAVRGLTTLFEAFPEKFTADKRNGIPKLIDEAWWEVMFYNKVYYKGTFLSIITPGANPWVWLGPPENAPPRISTLEQIEKIHQRSNSVTTLFTAASMARTAHLIAPYQNEDYGKTVKIAEECYEIIRKTDPNKVTSLGPFGVGLSDNFLMFQSGLLQLDMELYRITQDNKYKIDAKGRVEKILSLNKNDGTFYTDEAKTIKQSHIDIHYLALYEYIIMHPETPFKDDIKKVFVNKINSMKPLIDMSPFGQVGRYTKDGGISNIPGRSTAFAKNAWVLATAAILLDKPKYIDIAECQLQWITGLNPVDISMLTGIGKNARCCHHRYCFIQGHEDGKVPGAILNGISAGTGRLFNLGDYNTRNFVISDKLPVDYPVFDNDVFGWTWAYHNGETRNFTSGWFMLAAAQVEKALMAGRLAWIKNKKR